MSALCVRYQDRSPDSARVAYLGYFSQCSALLSEVDDDTTATILSLLDGLFDTEDEIGPASADVRAENITSVALEVSQSGSPALPGHCCE
jgi:hypothetical protein